ncbi:Rieske 2Fe-2S domain-containing protein [Virgisporangium aurantiacum]|uniref:Ring-hydroxylating oxygenase subunit alpha n=1 Tax=Virgisporangium aurantiacum TaxID=175570 RepID=A0A8J4E7X5_9ACTN|nr:Rieske 2Fe-2S domain-containing protein [Virgisporangium aurantiacum]GIJ62217.1 ring-hydroxylating oxygenase subunit alpha [Virgisporangium aurantiacum]
MLSAERNERLTRVGRGTPMGELLRRYWHPVAPVLELRERRVKAVRLLGEDLVLFVRRDGSHGLIGRGCPHRGADLSYGWVDGDQLRCPYHGWAFDGGGRCTEQPFEEAGGRPGFAAKVRVDAYPTQTLGGLVWAYLGPDPAPLLPNFEMFGWNQGFTEIMITELPCNWFQCHENGMDPVHFEWLHSNWTAEQHEPGTPRRAGAHLTVDFAEFDFGFICGREVTDGDPEVRPVSRSNSVTEGGMLCLWPYTLMTGRTVEWRVPMDDTRTLNITRHYAVLPDDVPGSGQDPDLLPYWYGPLTDGSTGRMLTGHPMNQDFAAWVGQGETADRTTEHLGRADAGITLLRRRFLEELERVAAGLDPAGTVRDPAANERIELPILARSAFRNGIAREKVDALIRLHRPYAHGAGRYPDIQAGRPEDIRRMHETAAGLRPGR